MRQVQGIVVIAQLLLEGLAAAISSSRVVGKEMPALSKVVLFQ